MKDEAEAGDSRIDFVSMVCDTLRRNHPNPRECSLLMKYIEMMELNLERIFLEELVRSIPDS